MPVRTPAKPRRTGVKAPRSVQETYDRMKVYLDIYAYTDLSYRLCEGIVEFGLSVFDCAQVFIDHLYVNPRDGGKGYGAKALGLICAWADSEKIELVLTASAFGSKSQLNDRQLVAWYKRYGFVPVTRLNYPVKYKGQRMRRPCSTLRVTRTTTTD